MIFERVNKNKSPEIARTGISEMLDWKYNLLVTIVCKSRRNITSGSKAHYCFLFDGSNLTDHKNCNLIRRAEFVSFPVTRKLPCKFDFQSSWFVIRVQLEPNEILLYQEKIMFTKEKLWNWFHFVLNRSCKHRKICFSHQYQFMKTKIFTK